jgi:hypothetical protein
LDGAGVGKKAPNRQQLLSALLPGEVMETAGGDVMSSPKNYSAEKPRHVFWYFRVARIISGDPVKTPPPNEA